MSRFIVLDSSPAGLLTNPNNLPEVLAINEWLRRCDAAGNTICLPEIVDYELRRELLRAIKTRGLARLEVLKQNTRCLPLTTPVMLRAAALWARARQTGQPTSDPKRLDVDVILAAQALDLELPTTDFIVATTNVAHLGRFVPADLWQNITP